MNPLLVGTVACSLCGITGVHACPGRPLPTPTPEDEARIDAALDKVFNRSPQPVKWKCWSISGDRYVYYTKKSCRYCVPVYAGDPDVDSPVVR